MNKFTKQFLSKSLEVTAWWTQNRKQFLSTQRISYSQISMNSYRNSRLYYSLPQHFGHDHLPYRGGLPCDGHALCARKWRQAWKSSGRKAEAGCPSCWPIPLSLPATSQILNGTGILLDIWLILFGVWELKYFFFFFRVIFWEKNQLATGAGFCPWTVGLQVLVLQVMF